MPDARTAPAEADVRRRPSGRAKAVLVACGLVLGLAFAEVAARFVYVRPWHEALVDEQLFAHTLPYRRNSFGLRDDDFAPEKPAGERRVLVIGDSFTYGFGVADEAAVFPERLERALDATAGQFGAQRIHLLNGGVPGSLTTDWIEGFRVLAPIYQPDLVVVVFFLRDGTRTHSIPEFFGKIREEITTRNRDSFLYGVSCLYRLVQDRLDRDLISSRYLGAFQRAYFGTAEEQAEWTLARQNLVALRDAARARGAEVGLVVFPILADLGDDYPFAAICTAIESWAREAGFPTHSLLPAFRGMSGPELWVSGADQHPNAKGHEIAARDLQPFFAELLRRVARPR
mgnify:CR=1 FL=1